MGYIAVDLDGTLAVYSGWQGEDHIGEPVPRMLARVKEWLFNQEVRIMTARVAHDDDGSITRQIEAWSLKHIGCKLPVTCFKDYGMIELWDDRAIGVIPNTGLRADGQ